MTTTNSSSNVRLTKRDYFNALISIADKADLRVSIPRGDGSVEITPEMFSEFFANEIDLLNRKNSPDRKPTEKQVENDKLKTAILDFLADGGKHTVTDFIKNVPECAGLSQQKVSALMRQLNLDNLVEKVIEKRVSYFKLAEKVGD